jgi:hypothetical protein
MIQRVTQHIALGCAKYRNYFAPMRSLTFALRAVQVKVRLPIQLHPGGRAAKPVSDLLSPTQIDGFALRKGELTNLLRKLRRQKRQSRADRSEV